MLQTPMLPTPQFSTSPVMPTAEATVIVPSTARLDVLEVKTTLLRRAATALFFFGMICARPCPSSWGAWAGIIAAVLILCSSSNKILCRARVARLLSVLAAVFAAHTAVSLVISFHAGMPVQIADKVHGQCMDVPADTFAWAQHKLVEHDRFHKGVSFLSRHMPNATAMPALLASEMNASHPAPLVGATEPEKWSQPEACTMVAHVVTCVAKMMMVGSTLAHLLLFLAAAAVVKRACCLRCAAYRAGLLTWKCGGACEANCERANQPAAVAAPVTKEMP